MSESEVPDERVDQFIVYDAYGEVMHQFQVFEMTLWVFLTRGIKPGMSESQAFDRITKWDGTRLGSACSGSEEPKPLSTMARTSRVWQPRWPLTQH